jgi:type II secretory pathway pseudopilin PulG
MPWTASAPRRVREEHGFTMIVALLTMLVTSLLIGAALIAVVGDVHLSSRDVAAKQAYSAAQAGLNAYLHQLNVNGDYWQTCSNDAQTTTSVPGATNGEQYAYQPIYNPGYSAANCQTSPISALVDSASGTINMEFFGYAGNPRVQRGIVASFRKDSPLDYLWYSVYEAFDPLILPGHNCAVFARDGRDPTCNLYWATGSVNKGPAYTQDQFNIIGSPVFGRGPNDRIASVDPDSVCSGGNCQQAVFKGTVVTGAPTIAPPADNSGLLTDAQSYGQVLSGTTNITLNGNQAVITNCPSDANSCTTGPPVNLASSPIIYVANAQGCTPTPYTPLGARYNFTTFNGQQMAYGCAGDVYISGNYTVPVTIAAANDIVLTGNVTTTTDGSGQPTGTATAGLVANDFVRMEHSCSDPAHDITIDAAILAIQHEFVLDNAYCGVPLGTETVNGAIAETFADFDGVWGGSGPIHGYVDNYTYDDRLRVTLPPYLFDIATAGWHVFRENLCTPGGAGNAAC